MDITSSHLPYHVIAPSHFCICPYCKKSSTDLTLTVLMFLLPKIHCCKITYDVSNAIFFMARHKPGNNTNMNVVTRVRGEGVCWLKNNEISKDLL